MAACKNFQTNQLTFAQMHSILKSIRPCTPLNNAHPARLFFCEAVLKPHYDKPPLTPEQHADLLLSRGLKGINKEDLRNRLESVNYYRLRGYTYPYQDNTTKCAQFLPCNSWPDIWNDYVMDSRLRGLLFESIGHIEIAFRTQLELVMSLQYGSRWYAKSVCFHDKECHEKDLSQLVEDWERSHEEFKSHYVEKYDNPRKPPAWMIFETATFGITSKFYSNIDSKLPEKAEITRFFGFSKSTVKILASWIHHLNTVRNICAHHSRLFSRVNNTRPIFPRRMQGKWVSVWKEDRLYASICIIKKLLDTSAPEFDFLRQLEPIIKMAKTNQLKTMGFPDNWKREPLFS